MREALVSFYPKGRNNMKKLYCLLSVILIAALLCPTIAFAAENGADEIYAEAITVEGDEVILADAPDPEVMPDLESYDLIIGDEAVLTVEQAETPAVTGGVTTGGYYAAEFDIPETTKNVYLTALTAEKVEEIQSRIIEKYTEGEDFSLTDLSFIDAEKTNGTSADTELCWAATASNMLAYTGWAAQADPSLATSDDVFERFIDAFTDNGGSSFYGIGWFFNGVNLFSGTENTAQATPGTGAYLTDYAFDRVSGDVQIKTDAIGGMNALFQYLKNGYAIGLGHAIYSEGEYFGGHADTCWGYIADTAYADTDANHYVGLFIADSDSDKDFDERRNAPNTLLAAMLTTGTDANGVMTFELDLDKKNHAVIEEFVWLAPYSDDVEKETSQKATRSSVSTVDFAITEAYLGTDVDSSADYRHRDKKIESNTKFFFTPLFEDLSDISFSGSAEIAFSFVNDATGESEYADSFNGAFEIFPGYGSSYGRALTKDDGLPVGDYTVTMSINGDQSVTEAYYYNNSFTFPLKVRDSYLLGDVDNSGTVDVMDATEIQRYLAAYGVADEKTVQRGAVTGPVLDIMGATMIQRYLADYSVYQPIGEKMLYD